MKNNILVQKFGGTSVGSPERIKAIASRAEACYKKGTKLVIVVSAMGDTTNKLVELASEISSSPSPREYDALISTGENVSASLLAMSLNDIGIPAISLAAIVEFIFSFNEFVSFSLFPLIVGLITTFLSSLLAIDFLLKFFSSNGLRLFIIYRVVFGVVILLNL